MLGNAVFTTVMSSSSMNTATFTTARVTHLRAMSKTSCASSTMVRKPCKGT